MARKLSYEAINKVSKRTDIKELICDEFGLDYEFGTRTVNRWLRENRPNNRLTCDAIVTIISKHTLLTRRQVLEDCQPKPRNNGTDTEGVPSYSSVNS